MEFDIIDHTIICTCNCRKINGANGWVHRIWRHDNNNFIPEKIILGRYKENQYSEPDNFHAVSYSKVAAIFGFAQTRDCPEMLEYKGSSFETLHLMIPIEKLLSFMKCEKLLSIKYCEECGGNIYSDNNLCWACKNGI